MQARNARYSAEEGGCPVPDKSACCQSIRPVRASSSTIQPEASVSRRDRATTLRTLHSTNTRLRPRCRSGVIGPNQLARSPLETDHSPPWTAAGSLIVCHSIRPAQVVATAPGRLIWHRTAVGWQREPQERLGLDHHRRQAAPDRHRQAWCLAGCRGSGITRSLRSGRPGAVVLDTGRPSPGRQVRQDLVFTHIGVPGPARFSAARDALLTASRHNDRMVAGG
jgi:hypothetical protein